jgi:hypothetical protein
LTNFGFGFGCLERQRTGGLAPLGGSGKVVEVDESYIGRLHGQTKKRGVSHKNTVLTLVEQAMSNLQNPIFTDETKAREWLEARIWPNG